MSCFIRLGLIKSFVRFYSFTRKTHYDVLDLPRNCTSKEIKEAYIKLSKAYHPDKNKDPNAPNNFIVITEAYNVLNNRSSRALYDRTLNVEYNSEYVYRTHNPYNYRNGAKYNYYYETSKSHGAKQQRDNAYYGSVGLNKISNHTLIAMCFCFAFIGFIVQMIVIRQSFLVNQQKIIEKSKKLAEELEIVEKAANENGNLLQTKLMMNKIINAATPTVATANLGQELANDKNNKRV